MRSTKSHLVNKTSSVTPALTFAFLVLFEVALTALGDLFGDRSVLRANADSEFGLLRFTSERESRAEDVGGHIDRIGVFGLLCDVVSGREKRINCE